MFIAGPALYTYMYPSLIPIYLPLYDDGNDNVLHY